MNKKQFISNFKNEDYIILSNVYDMVNTALNSNYIVYSNEFYTPNIYKVLQKLSKKISLHVYASGIFSDCERAMIALSYDYIENLNFPYDLITIKTKSKFVNNKHKDYLGAVLNLGIKREKIGDLIVKDNMCYVAMDKQISDFIITNLNFINKSPCEIQKIDIDINDLPTYNFENKIITVNSNRLDSIVSRIVNISRNKSVEFINDNKVLVDYSINNIKNFEVMENSIITVRGYGKYKIGKLLGLTSKNKLKIEIKKFI